MIPYIHIPDGQIGPLPLHPFGILVATGVLIGTGITTRRARGFGWDVVKLNSFLTWMLVTAFVLSHVLDSLFYHWDEVVRRPWSVIMLWEGLSSFGGFIGAVVGIVLWRYLAIEDGRLQVRKTPHPLLPFADLVLSVLPLGWMFGRMGCASVHDHPGAIASADSLLAVAAPAHWGQTTFTATDGVVTKVWFIEFLNGHYPRYDMGLLELMFTVVLTACFAITWLRRPPIGSYIVVTALSYAPVRFVMDYLRVGANENGDTRYGGLTPAQYCCVALFVFGIAMIFHMRRIKAKGLDLAASVREPPPPPPPAPPPEADRPADAPA
jgi:phosphatidylglycerol:prolipoprotein diacylglycerol transferase